MLIMKRICAFISVVILAISGNVSAYAETDDDLVQEFDYYENIIKEKLSQSESKESLQKRKDAVLNEAKKIFASRYSLKIVGSKAAVKNKDGRLSGNLLWGMIYFNTSQGPVSPYGELIWVNFGKTLADLNVDGMISGFPTISTMYKIYPKNVVVASRFGQPLLSIPYPFTKHCFNAKAENGLSRCVGREVFMMNVPRINEYISLNAHQMLDKLKGKKFVGFTECDDVKITINQCEFTPHLFTVVEFSKDGNVSISYPQIDRVELFSWEYSLTKDGSVLWITEPSSYNLVMFKNDYPNLVFSYYDQAAEVFNRMNKGKKKDSKMAAVIRNNGEMLEMMNPVSGKVFMIQPTPSK